MMLRRSTLLLTLLLTILPGLRAASAQEDVDVPALITKLNQHDSVKGSASAKSFRLIFDAALAMTAPPHKISESFNHTTIWPGMSDWSAVTGWAETNTKMGDALIEAMRKRMVVVGLPYGRSNVPANYQEAGIYVELGTGETLLGIDFAYFDTVDLIAAFVAADAYRLMEAGQVERALDLSVANLIFLRQLCDRDFLAEKMHCSTLLADALTNLRDIVFKYTDKISPERYQQLALEEMPFLDPSRRRFFMPEGDRIVAEELLKTVFDSGGQPNAEAFRSTFGAIQAEREPLTRWGAAKRWEQVASVHGSLDASLERLKRVYDDWWRRWRVQAYDPILQIPTEFARTNEIRYAAVLYSLRDLQNLFDVRDRLVLEVNGTAMAAGICGYKQTFRNYPRGQEMVYGQFVRKTSDVDPYDRDYGVLKYSLLTSRLAIDTPEGRLWLEPGQAVLWGKGSDNADNRAAEHSFDGLTGDIVLWPPVRSLIREQLN